jgi:hypothetical protein
MFVSPRIWLSFLEFMKVSHTNMG